MSRAIRRRVQAKRDVIELADHIARDSITAARRFRENVRSSLNDLLAMPEIGELFHSSNPTFRGMRWWQVKDFPNHLIFYRSLPDGIEVLRVLHGSRDLDNVFSSK